MQAIYKILNRWAASKTAMNGNNTNVCKYLLIKLKFSFCSLIKGFRHRRDISINYPSACNQLLAIMDYYYRNLKQIAELYLLL